MTQVFNTTREARQWIFFALQIGAKVYIKRREGV